MDTQKYPTKRKKKFIPKTLLNQKEIDFFKKLKKGLVGLQVFPQVSMNAVLNVEQQRDWKDRIDFWAKIIDFVVCGTECQVIAMIELDGPSHDSQEQQKKDADRDAMLKEAGYIVIRYDWRKEITERQLNNDFKNIIKQWNWMKIQQQIYKDEARILKELDELNT